MDNPSIVFEISLFVEDYFFFALVSRTCREAWSHTPYRPKETCLSELLATPATIRDACVCSRNISFGHTNNTTNNTKICETSTTSQTTNSSKNNQNNKCSPSDLLKRCGWKYIALNVKELPRVLALCDELSAQEIDWDQNSVINAVKCDNPSYITWVDKKGTILCQENTSYLFGIAALHGSLRCLKLFNNLGYMPVSRTAFDAALHGSIPVLKWLRSVGCPMADVVEVLDYAGHSKAMRWATSNGLHRHGQRHRHKHRHRHRHRNQHRHQHRHQHKHQHRHMQRHIQNCKTLQYELKY